MNQFRYFFARVALALTACALLLVLAWPGMAQAPQPSTPESPQAAPPFGFTYQGKLSSNGQPYTGTCDIQFGLWDAASAGALKSGPTTNLDVSVTGGLFSTLVGLSNTYSEALWLEVAVRCPAGSGVYTPLTGRTQISAAPMASALRYGSTIRPAPSGAPAGTDGLTVRTGVTEAGYGNPSAIIGYAGQTAYPLGVGAPPDRTGVYGASDSGFGVYGNSSTGIGVQGVSYSGNKYLAGVVGEGYGVGKPTGVYGYSSGDSGIGVKGDTAGMDSIAVYGDGFSGPNATGVQAVSYDGYALVAYSWIPCCRASAYITSYGSAVGLWAKATGSNAGVFGQGGSGVVGEAIANGGIGVIGRLAPGMSGLAGRFEGNIDVTGSYLGPVVNMHIDHPLDPTGQYLNQAALYAPEMLNVYSGNAVTDADGYATVNLPKYIEALNTDFRYQLTVVGQFAQAIVSSKVKDGQFVIRTDLPNVEVSWQVSGVRKDAYAQSNALSVEQPKPAAEQGLYLHPAAFGAPASQGVSTLYDKVARVDESIDLPGR